MPRIELPDAPPRTGATHASDGWSALLADSPFDKPEVWFEDKPEVSGDLTEVYRGSFNDLNVAVKVTRDTADEDLVEHEAAMLRNLYPEGTVDEKFYRYFPRLIASTRWEGHLVNIVPWFDGYLSLEDIRRAYPSGIDFRDMVWMFKRLLSGIGFAHENKNMVHGALIPPHVLVHPLEHGAKIIDWSYAVENASDKNDYIRAMSRPFRAFYAPEVLGRQPPTSATDIYMAAKIAIALVGGDLETGDLPGEIPTGVQLFLQECIQENPLNRPQNAWDLHERFDKLLLSIVGKPTYRPFRMP